MKYLVFFILALIYSAMSIAAPIPQRANCGTGYSPKDCKEGETPGSIAWPWTPETAETAAKTGAWRLFRAPANGDQGPEYVATFDGEASSENGRMCQRVARSMTDEKSEYWCEPGSAK